MNNKVFHISRLSIGLTIVVFGLLTSCSQALTGLKTGGGGVGGGSSGIVLDTSNGANTIQSLPDLKLKNAPDSLSSGSDLKLKSGMRAPSGWDLSGNKRSVPILGSQRVQGDVTSFDLNSLTDVKSQGWINMRSQLKDSTVVIFLNILKAFATNKLASGQAIPLGADVYVGTQYVEPMKQNMDMGYIKCISPTANTFDVYWSFVMNPEGGTTASSVARVGIGASPKRDVGNGGPMNILIYIHIVKGDNGKSKVDFMAKVLSSGMDSGQIIFSRFDEATGKTENFNAQSSGSFNLNSIFSDNNVPGALVLLSFGASSYGYTNTNASIGYYNTNGSYVYSNGVQINSSTYTNMTIGWGDNFKGGVISLYGGLSYDNVYGNYTNDNIYTEFYNGNGGLVFKNYGTATPPDTSWLNSYTTYGYNLSGLGGGSAPSSVQVVSVYVSSNYYNTTTGASYYFYTNYTTLSDGVNSTNFDQYTGSFYWKNNPYSSTWQPGDSVYWYDAGNYVYNYTNNYDAVYVQGTTNFYHSSYVSISTNTYKVGYTVPSVSTYLYKDYFMQNSWPLKYLSLNYPYNNGFQLNRQEGESYTYNYSYYDQNFQSVNYSYSYTNYDWWLKNQNQPNRLTNVVTNAVYNYNTQLYDITNIYTNYLSQANGDIRLQNVNAEDVYVWDPSSTNMYRQKGLFVYGTGSNPKYFTFSQQGLVNIVTANITSIYANNVLAFDYNAYISAIPAFPATNQFPILP